MIKNISLSFGINFVNLLFPLFLIPYYIKTFGIDSYGLIAISISLVNIISVLYDYSWYAFVPIEIAKINNNQSKLNAYLSKVINTKNLLFLPSMVLLAGFIFLFDALHTEVIFSISIVVFLVSRLQNNLCFFIGLNDVTPYFILNSIFKIACIVLIFITLKDQLDYKYVFYYLGMTDILLFVFSTYYLQKKHGFKYQLTPLKEIKKELQSGLKLFLTNVTISALLNSSTLILGIFIDTKTAGIYSVAEKLIMLCKQSISVLFQGVYHKACTLAFSTSTTLKRFLKMTLLYYLALYGLGTLLLLLVPELIVSILSSNHLAESSHYLVLLAPIPLIAAASQPAYITLLIHNEKNTYFNAHVLGLLINIVLSVVFCYFFGVYGIISSLVLTEFFITAYLNIAVLANQKLNFFKYNGK